MKNSKLRRIGSFLLALVIAVSSYVGVSIPVFADSWPNPTASAEPTFAGYRVKDVANWSPETDPYAELMRAQVPLQDRNAAFAATQANPNLASDAQVMLMQGDYGNSFFGSTMYTNEFSEHVLNYWQYTDYFSPWHGAATAYTPDSLYDPVTSDWRARGFEFGIVNIPNPAYTNAAHKNGVLSIACIYFDPAFRPGQTCADMVEKDADGNFPVADQLIAMAEYYGYDGYFLNQEEGNYEDFKPFMAYLTANGLYTQWYDTNSSFNSSKSAWLKDSTHGQIHNSVFVNYGWNSYTVDSAVSHAASIGVDPFEAVFFGAENNQNGFHGGHSSARNITNLYDESGNPRASVALFTPSDFYQRGLEGLDTSADGDPRPTMQKDGYQWMVAERERMFFSGVYEDPTNTGIKAAHSREDVYVSDASGWVGVADFISERSVISGNAFYTNFNTGHGMQYFKEGEVSKDEEWTNINIQEILPTWQWWIESTDSTKLEADFDYGSKLVNLTVDGTERDMPYTQIGAYDGGSSLVVYGELSGTDSLHLYKTDLDVNAASKATVIFKKTSDDAAEMKLGLIFEDAPETTVALDIENSAVKGDWTTAEVDLAAYAGRQIAAITLEFEGTASAYQMNIGSLKITDQSYKPAAPTGLNVDYAYADGQMIVSWDMADYSEVIQYNLYGVQANGDRVYLGGIYDELLYVKNTFAEDFVVLQLCAVGIDGTESAPATYVYRYDDKVSNVAVLEAESASGLITGAANAGELTVSFDTPATGAPDSYAFEVTLRNIASDDPDNKTYTATADGTATGVTIAVPVDERYEYDLKIYAVNGGVKGDPICYRGYTNDNYSEPIAEDDIRISGSTVRLVDPDSVDWYKMTLTMNGTQVASFKRGASSGNQMRATLSTTTGVLSVVVEDYAGNKSPATILTLQNGVIVNPDDMLTEADIPDAALRNAIMTQAGVTRADAEAYTGTLDLTGTAVKDLTGIDILKNATVINFTNCDSLTEISGLEGCEGLTEVIVSGCDKLEKLDLSGLGLEKLTGEGPFPKLVKVDISDNKLDLSEGTPERAFLDTVTAIVDANLNAPVTPDPDPEPEPTPDGEFTLGDNLLPNATVVSSSNIVDASKVHDGDTAADTYASDRSSANTTVIFDLGEEKTIGAVSAWTKYNDSGEAFGMKSVKFEIADTADGTYTEIGTATIDPEFGTAGTLVEGKLTLDEVVTGRYIKATVTEWWLQANGDPDWPAMYEMMAYEAVPVEAEVVYELGDNLLPNASVVSSSNIVDVSKVHDGDTAADTYASDRSSANTTVIFDLGEEKVIGAVSAWTKYNDSGEAFGMKSVKFEIADTADGTYTEIGTATIDPEFGTAGTLVEGKLTLDEVVTGRYIKATVTEWWLQANGDPDWPAMYEMMVYEAVPASAQSEPAPAAVLMAEPAAQSDNNLVIGASFIQQSNIADYTQFIDGDITTSTYASNRTSNASLKLDLGEEKSINAFSVWTQMNSDATPRPFGIKTAVLSVSNERDTGYVDVGTATIEAGTTVGEMIEGKCELDEAVTGRYVMITVTEWWPHPNGGNDWPAMYEVAVYEGETEPVKFDNQRPVPYPAFDAIDGTTIEKEVQDDTLDMTSLIEKAVTIRGSAYATLDEQLINGVKFIADDLDLTVVPSANADISISDQNRAPIEGTVIDLSIEATYTVLYKYSDGTIAATVTVIVGDGGDVIIPVDITVNPTILYATQVSGFNPAEAPENAFDDSESTKWCPGGDAVQAELIIDVGAYYRLTQWDMSHAGVNWMDGSGRNTRDFALQVLNVENPTAEQLADVEWLTNDENWTTVASYVNNQLNRTSYEFTESVTARYFRLDVTRGDSSSMWPSTRIYEWSMYGIAIPKNLDTTALEQAIADAEALNEEEFTPATWADLEAALVNAQDVLADDNALQADVDRATELLNEAMNALMMRPATDVLEELIASAEALNEDDYSATSWANLQTELGKAKLVLANGNATPGQVAAAEEAMQDALNALVDLTELKELLDIVDTALEEGLDEYYTLESWEAFMEVVEEARELIADPDVTQAEVDAMVEALFAAEDELVEAGDAEELTGAIDEAKDIDLDKYTDESAEKIEEAIAKAEAAVENRASQDELDAALAELEEAIDSAVEKSDVPDTGDYTSFALPVVLMLAACVLFIIRRRFAE